MRRRPVTGSDEFTESTGSRQNRIRRPAGWTDQPVNQGGQKGIACPNGVLDNHRSAIDPKPLVVIQEAGSPGSGRHTETFAADLRSVFPGRLLQGGCWIKA